MIYIFTGAGISADSGLPTFRDANGLWENYDVNEVCYFPKFKSDLSIRQKVFDFYNARKYQYSDCQPNAAHLAITKLQEKRNDVKVITTNIDLLHEQAGNRDVLHLHGQIDKMSCIACFHTWDIGMDDFKPGYCPRCGGSAKPGVVFFNEEAPEYVNFYKIIKSLSEEDTFIIVGTTLQVVNPIALMKSAKVFHKPKIIYIDKHIDKDLGIECYEGSAAIELPRVLKGYEN